MAGIGAAETAPKMKGNRTELWLPEKQHPADEYIAGVISGEIVSGELVRLACQRHKRDLQEAHLRGLRFDRAKAQRVIDFFAFLRHSKGEWAGQQFGSLHGSKP